MRDEDASACGERAGLQADFVARLRRREPAALDEWVERESDGLYTFVSYRVGRDRELAADVVQETFFAALARLPEH